MEECVQGTWNSPGTESGSINSCSVIERKTFSDSKRQPYFRRYVLEERSESGNVDSILGLRTVVTGTSNSPESLWIDYDVEKALIFGYLLGCAECNFVLLRITCMKHNFFNHVDFSIGCGMRRVLQKHFLLWVFLFRLYLHMANCQPPNLAYRCRPNTALEAIEAVKATRRGSQLPGNRKTLKSAQITPGKFSCQYLFSLFPFPCAVDTKKKRKRNNGFSRFLMMIYSEMVSLG